MLQPTRSKYRKAHKGRIHGKATRAAILNYGTYGLKALTPERVTARQIEAARRALTRHMKRAGKVWIRIFPDTPVSQKPAEVRQGKGKGNPEDKQASLGPPRTQRHPTCKRSGAPERRPGEKRKEKSEDRKLKKTKQ